jgi:hypothetical protein
MGEQLNSRCERLHQRGAVPQDLFYITDSHGAYIDWRGAQVERNMLRMTQQVFADRALTESMLIMGAARVEAAADNLATYVREARESGFSWHDVGRCLQIPESTARHRYGSPSERPSRSVPRRPGAAG